MRPLQSPGLRGKECGEPCSVRGEQAETKPVPLCRKCVRGS